jgi:hypothetical protein
MRLKVCPGAASILRIIAPLQAFAFNDTLKKALEPDEFKIRGVSEWQT